MSDTQLHLKKLHANSKAAITYDVKIKVRGYLADMQRPNEHDISSKEKKTKIHNETDLDIIFDPL